MRDPSRRPIEILIVEDDPASRYLLEDCLRNSRLDAHVCSVTDGEEAVAYLADVKSNSRTPRPDLILLDLNMPRKDGREVLAEIKRDPALKRIPVIVMTNSREQCDINAVYDLHANCYLRKAFDLEELNRQVRLIEDFWFEMVLRPTADPASIGDNY